MTTFTSLLIGQSGCLTQGKSIGWVANGLGQKKEKGEGGGGGELGK
jgi:hypothetical protein